MQIFFAGAEAPTHLNLLKQCGVERVAININNLARHTSKYGDWATNDRLGGLDWIVYADTPSCPVEPVLELLAGSQVACESVAGPVNWATDTWIRDSDLGFLPIWDGRDTSVVRIFAEDYEGIVLPDSVVDNAAAVRTARAALPAMGVLGGLTGRSKGLERFDTVVSSAWWAVQKHGETQVWVGNRLVRLNAEDKHLKRQRYADAIEALGCDVSAVLADDPTETVRCAVLSWMALERHLNTIGRQTGHALVTNPAFNGSPGNVIPISGVASAPRTTGHQTAQTPTSAVSTRPLPLVGLQTTITETEDAEGNKTTESYSTIEVTQESARQCSTCILSASCPAFNPGARCAYNIPVVIKTKDQRQALLRSLVEVQGQRALFAAFSEQALGTPDALVGKEIDRVFDLIDKWKQIEDNSSKLHISVDASGEAGQAASAGLISRLFGEQAGTNARALDRPMIVDEIIEEMDMEGDPVT